MPFYYITESTLGDFKLSLTENNNRFRLLFSISESLKSPIVNSMMMTSWYVTKAVRLILQAMHYQSIAECQLLLQVQVTVYSFSCQNHPTCLISVLTFTTYILCHLSVIRYRNKVVI